MHSRKRRARGAPQSPGQFRQLVHTSTTRSALGNGAAAPTLARTRGAARWAPSPCSFFVLASAAGARKRDSRVEARELSVEDPHGQRQAHVEASSPKPRRPPAPAGVEALFGGRAIVVRGAREHNLKNVDLAIPRDKLVVFTGLSGSGKSSLAFDTIYAEGQRRYVESLSAYARQFLEMMQKPDVDQIDGLSPAISIEQKTTSKNPRSTVGTVTEIHDYMRLLWARVGIPYSPATGLPIESQTVSQMVDRVLALPRGHAPLSAGADRARPQGRVPQGDRRLQKRGFQRLKIDGAVLRDRRRAGARQEAQARHRRGGRPHRRAPRHGGAARRELRDGARARRRARGGRVRRQRPRARASRDASSSPRNSPARSPASPSPRSSRGCSRSTTRTAPARSATASARS